MAFGLLALGSLVGLLMATQAWWSHPVADSTGNDATGALAGVLAGAAAAGTGLAALSGRIARTLLGVLVVGLGIAMVAVASTASPQVTGVSMTLAPGAEELDPTASRWIYLVCGVLVMVGAAVLLVRARRWPQRRDRYARVAAQASTVAEDDAADVWTAMDAGFDPTDQEAGPEPDSDPSGRNSPDRRE